MKILLEFGAVASLPTGTKSLPVEAERSSVCISIQSSSTQPSSPISVYDLLADQRTVKISAHSNDVNSCCWADTGSCNVLVSASDDTFLKVW